MYLRFGQCSIPAFEGLLDEPYNACLMKLLFRFAEWHAFGKLRMHTTSTLDRFEALTKEFGQLMRQFQDLTCSGFDTFELPREERARQQRRERSNAPALKKPAASSSSSTEKAGKVKKTLNLKTPKFHSLGDYVRTIHMFGCTDSYSTQLVW